MKILGIDPSINCTACCIKEGNSYKYYLIPSNPTKKLLKLKHKDIEVCPYNKEEVDKSNTYNENEICKSNNFHSIAILIRSIIELEQPDLIQIEGCAYSGGGQSTVDLAQLQGVLRFVFNELHIPFKVMSPNSVKKFATGNGNACKKDMIRQWKSEQSCMNDLSGVKIDDLSDSYFIANYIESENPKKSRKERPIKKDPKTFCLR